MRHWCVLIPIVLTISSALEWNKDVKVETENSGSEHLASARLSFGPSLRLARAHSFQHHVTEGRVVHNSKGKGNLLKIITNSKEKEIRIESLPGNHTNTALTTEKAYVWYKTINKQTNKSFM